MQNRCAVRLTVLSFALLSEAVLGLRLQQKQAEEKCSPAVGKWVRKSKPPHDYQINGACGAGRGLVPKGPEGFPEFMMYDWEPDDVEKCPVTRMNFDNFCEYMSSNNLTHFAIAGDSINFMMAQSLWKLLGQRGDVQKSVESADSTTLTSGEMTDAAESHGFEGRINCKQGPIIFNHFRNDMLDDTWKPTGCPHLHGRNHCNPWWKKYSDNAAKTLLVANAGAHYHAMQDYQRIMEPFLARLYGLKKANVVFRQSVPGHEHCETHDKPFAKREDFNLSTQYSWNMMPAFNDYVKEKLQQKKNDDVKIMMLDVFEMSVMRPDGHMVTKKKKDCLHYWLPGVADHWNHLMMTELAAGKL